MDSSIINASASCRSCQHYIPKNQMADGQYWGCSKERNWKWFEETQEESLIIIGWTEQTAMGFVGCQCVKFEEKPRPKCPRCDRIAAKDGFTRGSQRWRCNKCGWSLSSPVKEGKGRPKKFESDKARWKYWNDKKGKSK